MLRFILYLFAFTASVFLLSASIRFGLKGAALWDNKISNKLDSIFMGFNWHYRIPFAIGVIPEYYFYMVLGNNNYFRTNWWALKTGAFLSFLMFLAFLTNKSESEAYYSLQTISESGLITYVASGVTFWYLNIINLLIITLFALIVTESIRMHNWYAPIRIVLYSLLSLFMYTLTIIVMTVIIMVTFLYIAYKIIKYLMTSSRRRKEQEDDHDVSETLNNNYRVFRAELYAWENELRSTRSSVRKEKKTIVKRKRPTIKRKPKPKPKNDDIPRFHPD